MNRLIRLFTTSVGSKLVIAATGLLLFGFLLAHLYGNLKIFQGPDTLNAYAAWLSSHPLLWIARVGLFVVFVVHILLALNLAKGNLAARPVRYRYYETREAGFASRYMVLSGLVVLAFLIYHLLHFTFGVIDGEHARLVDSQQRHDVYSMMVHGFRNPWIAGSYVLAMLLLGLHLMHGSVSLFQTLGINHESYNSAIWIGCMVLVSTLVIGNCSIPVLVYVGNVPLPGGSP